MRVCIHALRLADIGSAQLGGNFFHVYRLVESLSRLRDLELFVLADGASVGQFARILPSHRVISCGSEQGGLLAAETASYRASRFLRPDVFHRPIGQLPMVPLHGRLVMGVADLNFRDLGAPLLKRAYKEFSYRASIARSDAIVCISEFTRVRLRRCFPRSARKSEIIHHGAEGLRSEPEPIGGLDARQFWICFAHRPNKNLEAAVSAYSTYAQSDQGRGRSDKLVVLGNNDYSRSVLAKFTDCAVIKSKVVVLDYVSEGALVWLYRNASGLLFPSRYEGFGLPIVEAMSSGCPVIAGDIPPLREVGGSAALYSAIDDWATMAKQMESVGGDGPCRDRHIALGHERVRLFSWDHAAAQTVALYRRILEKTKK